MPDVVCSQRQLESRVTEVESVVQDPGAVHDWIGSDGWVSVVRVPTCWAETPAARRERRAFLETMVDDVREDGRWMRALMVDTSSSLYTILNRCT